MSGYVLSILGIVLVGIVIDVVMPSGVINKYIKSLFSIFVVAVILNPIITFVKDNKDFTLHYDDYEVQESIMNYIFNERVKTIETAIMNELESGGISKIDIKINYSIESNELNINSCTVFMQNAVISSDKLHINKYEFISDVVNKYTDLTDEEIIYEWKREKIY